MPPLRDREDDVVEIAEEFIAIFSEREGKTPLSLSGDTIKRLLAYDWPGNVRQLQNVIRSAIVMHEGKILEASMLSIPDSLDPDVRLETNRSHPSPITQSLAPSLEDSFLHRERYSPCLDPGGWKSPTDVVALELIETVAIERAVGICDGNIPRAATYLGVSPSTIYRKRGINKKTPE